MKVRLWPTRSELFTDSRLGHQVRSGFAACGARRARAGVRRFLIGTITLVHALTAAGSAVGAEPAADAGAGPDAEAPPPLSKPPRLLRFVEATPPASLAVDERADVVLAIDIDEHGRVTDVVVLK